tara:strand:+ start:103 stop:477 length:375 start_codon:yes stop_codon:yes gene_type:complete
MTFEDFCKKLCRAAHLETHDALTRRANALRKAIEDGIVMEHTAIKALHTYADELEVNGAEWSELEKLMEYSLKRKSVDSRKYVKARTPEAARTIRGDFDSPHYDEGRAVHDDGLVIHSLHMPAG